ncbi:tetratricopeptide repeat protein [Amaricoccus sp. B4]|uniref:O-linked N-acetylglucosamine transferase, SPINDLY family protein n=1 Tax=Amaricoccus sp. B4 TaxID=3368557 RepID=UPI003716890A
MNIAAPSAPLCLASDEDWLATCLGAPGGLAALSAAQAARLDGVLHGLSLHGLLSFAGRAADADAVRLYKGWLDLHAADPNAFGAWFNLGVVLMRSGNPGSAAIAYSNVLALKPELHEAGVNLGLALEASGRRDEALAAWRRVLPGDEQRRLLHMHLGRLLEEEGDIETAQKELRAALLIDPRQPDVQQHLVHMRQRAANWPVLAADIPGLSAEELGFNCGPLGALALHDDPALQRDICATWIARKVPAAPERLAPRAGHDHARIRVGYLSTDFCRHAMSYLIAEVLERHDRSAFEIFGYCASPEDGSDVRRRVIAAFDHFRIIGPLSDEAAARQIRADEIDILIDLNGLTKGARIGVLRWKPAPVQATYLGYIGPVALPELDWLIADEVAIPPELAADYAPKPLLLEGCYQANDSHAPVLPAVTRAEEGLPDDAFVFCCFSHHYKITEVMFEAWMQILAQCPGAVLWLVEDNPASDGRLAARWTARGLAAERLIFAPRVDPERYRARFGLADLFLDTMPYNAGTIASDALRMGLPLLTLQGRAFAARMASSLVTAVGMPECVATSREGYVARAVAIARDPAELARLKAHLAGNAWARTLGDSTGFTRRLEAAYRRIRLSPR